MPVFFFETPGKILGIRLSGNREAEILAGPTRRLPPGGFFPTIDPTKIDGFEEKLKLLEQGQLPEGWGPRFAAVLRKFNIFDNLSKVEDLGNLVTLSRNSFIKVHLFSLNFCH